MATKAEIKALVGTGPPASVNSQIAVMRWAKQNPPKDMKVTFNGKTVIITGSNTGIGLPAATKFVANGAAKVILAVRTPAKGEQAKQSIVAATNCNASIVEVMKLDMSDPASVREFAQEVSSRFETIDIAVLNAGIAPPNFGRNAKTGYEEALQVNILSTANLAMLLLPKLKSTALVKGTPSQLTLTGSIASKFVTSAEVQSQTRGGQSLIQKLNDSAAFDAGKAYGQTKLITQYMRQGLVEDFSKNDQGEIDVYINVACPGFCTTDLGRDFPWYTSLPTKLMQMYGGRTAEQGSRELVSATVLGEIGHNQFWSNDCLDDPGLMVSSEEGKILQKETWKEIRDICQKQ